MNKSPNSSDYRHKCVYSCLILDDIICVVPSCCTKIENHWLLFSHFMRNENPQEPVVYFMVLLTLAIVIIIMNYSYMSPSWQLEWLMSSYYHDNNFNNRESIFLVISDIPINIMIPSNVYIYMCMYMICVRVAQSQPPSMAIAQEFTGSWKLLRAQPGARVFAAGGRKAVLLFVDSPATRFLNISSVMFPLKNHKKWWAQLDFFSRIKPT